MNLSDYQALYQECLARQHTLEDVLSGRCLVGVEGDSGRDLVRAKQLGLFTCNVKGVDIFAKCEADARPLIHYLERGGVYGSVEFSRLLGYTDEEIAGVCAPSRPARERKGSDSFSQLGRTMFKSTADQDAHGRSIALMKFLSGVAKRLGVAEHVYVVGGAVRNFLIDQPIKDIDVVIDSVAAGHDSEWFAQQVAKAIPAKTNLTTNNYGVAILSIDPSWVLDGYSMAGPKNTGEVIEIANARKESYGGETGKGYKPHLVEPATIEEDLVRREFTFNTLLWRLSDLAEGPDKAEVIDMLGRGRADLAERTLQTPVDPDKTFSDDPTRMLRAIKFVAKYGFKVPPDMAASIRKNAPKLKGMPWDAVRKIVTDDILDAPNPRKSIALLQDLGLADVLREMMQAEPGFAAAMGRSLSDKEALLLLDLLDLGWVVRTPIGFLDKAGQKRLRGILLSLDDAEGKAFVDALVKPPINQPRLFEEYEVPPKERQQVTGLARQFLLDDPTLAGDARGLEALVEQALSRRMPKVAAERVVARFVARGGR